MEGIERWDLYSLFVRKSQLAEKIQITSDSYRRQALKEEQEWISSLIHKTISQLRMTTTELNIYMQW